MLLYFEILEDDDDCISSSNSGSKDGGRQYMQLCDSDAENG
jgi:hypothetical protein